MHRTRIALATCLALCACSDAEPTPAAADPGPTTSAAQPSLSIEPTQDPARPVIIAGLPAAIADALPEGPVPEAEGRPVLHLRIDQPGPSAQPIVGHYTRDGTRLRFSPAMPLQAGKRYRASLELGTRTLTRLHELPAAAATEPTRLLSIEPGTDEVPANILRFYANFSAPMQGGDSLYEHVHLVDLATSEPIEMAWREIQLWSTDRTRLTLLVHPGRVKRDITFSKEIGPVLEAGHRYRLRIDAALADAAGNELAQAFDYTFSVTATDGEGPRPDAWRIAAPVAGTTDPLTLRFDEPMDTELLRTRIRVLDEAGQRLEGEIAVGDGARTWRFAPATEWRSGKHRLSFTGELEDLAGNTSTAPFDRPVGHEAAGDRVLALPFDVGP